jgi:hypothetical protein
MHPIHDHLRWERRGEAGRAGRYTSDSEVEQQEVRVLERLGGPGGQIGGGDRLLHRAVEQEADPVGPHSTPYTWKPEVSEVLERKLALTPCGAQDQGP